MTSSTSTFTYWSLLGVPSGSDSQQIKKAFRREARRWHPDLNRNSPIAEERFKWINEAYSVLTDPGRRMAWESAGRPAFQIKEPNRPSPNASTPNASPSPSKRTSGNTLSGFNSAERLLLTLISILLLWLLNAYVL